MKATKPKRESTMSAARRLLAPPRHLTTEQYLSGPPDEFKAELIYGELVMSPRATDWHQELEHYLTHLLRCWTKAFDLGWVWHDLDMVLDERKDLVYRPDVLYLAKTHAARRKRRRVFGPADLCVEILSPSDKPLVRRRKFTDYERYGVAWYWIINVAKETLEEHELVTGVYRCRHTMGGSDWFAPGLFPGLEFRLRPLIEGDLKNAVRGKAKKLV